MNINIYEIIAILAPVIGGIWWLGRKLFRMESLLTSLGPFFEYIESSLGIIAGAMERGKLLSEEEAKKILSGVPYSKIFQSLSKAPTGNPVTTDELEKLKHYVERVQKGDLLSKVEALEFQRLSRLLAEEKKDEGTRWLLMIAAFLTGWWIGSTRD